MKMPSAAEIGRIYDQVRAMPVAGQSGGRGLHVQLPGQTGDPPRMNPKGITLAMEPRERRFTLNDRDVDFEPIPRGTGLYADFQYSPVLRDFLCCSEPYSIVVGSVGSGKTFANIVKLYMWALEQEPGPDNIRYFKGAIVRNTMNELIRTTIETYTSIFVHQMFGDIRRSSPLSHGITWEADGAKGGRFESEPNENGLGLRWTPNDANTPGLDFHVDFFSLDRPQQVKSLLSYEATYMFFNEIREIPKAIVDAAGDRVGRYPSLAKGGVKPTKSGVAGDSNPPDETHWLYKFYLDPPKGWAVRKQPPGLVEVVAHHEAI